jgi:iron transport multicopper oxidase
MSGGGLVSDAPGQILFATGNGASNGAGPIPGDTPPADLGEAVVRVAVQADGTLKAVDFFSPYDAATLDESDIDFGSGSPVALPDSYFGTTSIPHLAVEVGKEGYVYLLNRDHLGGVGEGSNGTDAVVGRYGPNGGVWSSPAVWPGDGGYIYIPTSSGSEDGSGLMDAYQYGLTGAGSPTLSLVGRSPDSFGFGSSAPVVTSDGTTSGSALVWTVWSPGGSGVGAQIRAYNPVPVDGTLQMVWSAPVGTASKFNPPGVADNRIYVGTRDGNVLGFGAPVGAPLSAPTPTFPATVVGQTSTVLETITANSPVTINSFAATGPFTPGTPSQTLPASLAAGDSMSVPVTFAPTTAGPAGGGLTIDFDQGTDPGTYVVSLTGSGEVDGPSLTSTTKGVSFGGIAAGHQSSTTVGFLNNGSQPLTISDVGAPEDPFSVSGAPEVGATLQPGAEVLANVIFAPTANGNYSSTLEE